MSIERLDKILVKLGLGSRKEAKVLVGNGRLKLNGKLVLKSDIKINTQLDILELDNKILDLEEFVYYVINKPKNCVCALKDNIHATVMSYIEDKRIGLVPVGRLDLDTTGVLLITDDGKLNHNLLSPSKHVKKVYKALIKGQLPDNVIDLFKQGIVLDDGICKEANLEIIEKSELSTVKLEIIEGRYHQVKRMFLSISCEVVELERIEFANLNIEKLNLAYGKYRKLTKEEIEALKSYKIDNKSI